MRKNLLFFIVVCLILNWHTGFGQDREVSGKVTDAEDGSGLPGVNVLLQGTKSGAVTDMDGNYKITIPEGATLVFSYIGYETKVIAVGAQAIINVEMFFDVKQLSEIVVTAQGIEKSARSLGYSATEVNAEEITKGRTTDVMSSLQGKVAGATITTASGAPGASTKVIVRGYSSIGSNNNPLYIVDGVPINNSSNAFNQSDLATDVNRSQDFGNRANDVNPDDVESITILKGASATALYGSRAANGVIIITTKKGKANSGVNIGFTSSATISEPLRLPQLQNKFGQGWSGHFAYEENGSWGPIMDGKERLWGNVVNNSQQLKTFEPRENLKDFYEIGNSFINTISLHGGSDLTTYYLSYGNVQGNGVTPGDADVLDRNTLSLRGTLSGNKVSARASLNYSHKEQSVITVGQGGAGTTTFQELIQIPRDHSIVDMKDYNDPFNNLDNFYTLYAQNPYWSINENGNKFGEDRVYGNVNVSYDFTDWLSASYRLGADVANSQVKDWIAVAEITPGAPNFGTQPIPGQVTEYSRYARELDHTFMVNSSRDITERFAITGLIGLNNNERYFRNLSIRVDDLDIPGFYDISNSSGTPVTTSFESLRRLIGLYGQFEASYNDYLYLTLLARNDWSSTLPKDNNTFFYPGANLSFVFSELVPGIENILTEGKVRVSYGKTGNDAPPYSIESVLIGGNIDLPFGDIALPFAGVNGFEVSNQIGNPSLQPEITSEYEIGTNLSFYDKRIGVDFAYYDRTTTDQLLRVPVAVSSGYTSQVKNLGKVSNKGIEVLLTGTPIRTSDITWDISYNFSQNKNEVVELTEGLDKVVLNDLYGIELVAIPGKPIGVIMGHTEKTDPQGRIIVNNAGLPQVATDKVEYGNINADFTMGLSTTVRYKDFSLSANMDYRKGGLMYAYTQRLTQFVGNSTNSLYNDRKPWVVPNSVVQVGTDEYVENTIPIDYANVYAYWNQTSNNSRSKDHVIDRSFMKLREVTLGYRVPESILSKTPISSLYVNLVGRNLLLFTPLENNIIDPETTTFGNDLLSEFGEFGVGPTLRSYGLSLKATF